MAHHLQQLIVPFALFTITGGLPLTDLIASSQTCYSALRSDYNIDEFWWQQANEWTAIASMFDIFAKLGVVSPSDIPPQFTAMPNFLMNCYNDDGLWWTLAFYKVYELGQQINDNNLTQRGEVNFKNGLTSIMTANRGNNASATCSAQGILWCNTDTSCKTCNCGCPYKNAIANELFLDALIKSKLTFPDFYNNVVVTQYGYNFDDILDWLVTQSGMITSDYQIRDGLDYPSCEVTGNVYSYNQGVILNALVQSAKYNDVLFGILQRCYDDYTADNNDGFGRRWNADSCNNQNPADGDIFDAIFIRYLSDIMLQLLTMNATLANKWLAVMDNTLNKLQYNNQSGADTLYPCPINYLSIHSDTVLNKSLSYNVWIKSVSTSSNNEEIFMAMHSNTGYAYNYIGDAVANNDQGDPGWVLRTSNNGESYCIYNAWNDQQSNGKYAYLSAKTMGSGCNENIWNGQGNYGDVIQASGACLRDELFYVELVDAAKGAYSIRCAKCNLSPNIDQTDHPMFVGMYNGGPGYNHAANADEQYLIYSRDTKQQIMDLQYITLTDVAMNQLTQYNTLQWFVAGIKVQT